MKIDDFPIRFYKNIHLPVITIAVKVSRNDKTG